MAKQRPFGLWDSPITAESLAKAGLSIESNFAICDGKIYFVERRPNKKNEVLVALSLSGMSCEDITLAEHGVRSTVHEYGGLAWNVSDAGVAFVEAGSQHIILYDGHEYRSLHGVAEGRFGDLHYDKHGGRYLAVGEFHEGGEGGRVRNELWSISADGAGESYCLQSGADFYASPCVSSDGKRCAWLQWNHPLMAWDGAELWQADIGEDGRLCNHEHIRGGMNHGGRESCFQPQYDGAGNLYFICDNGDGFWQLHCLDSSGGVCDFPLKGESGWVECGLPLWQLGMRTYDFTGDGGILLAGCDRGVWGLYLLAGDIWQKIDCDYCSYDGLRCSGGRAYFLGSRVGGAPILVELDIGTGDCRELRKCGGGDYDIGYISRGRSFTFESGGFDIQGYFYAPTNKDYRCDEGGEGGEGLPPLIMRCHGGPTAGVHGGFAGKIQYWTSRGFAVCDLNYRGSTGFGRRFREALYGEWGIADVDDYISAGRYLVGEGLVDGGRLIISGSSAGGFTVLSVLAFRDGFSVGCSAYGIGDLLLLASDTHKFESHYLDSLVGVGGEDLYRGRSPYYSAGGIDCPVLFLQGSEDRVVPMNQMYSMVEVLEGRGIWCEYILFEGEGHGFRDGDNIVRAYEGELDFYVRTLKLGA